MAILFSRACEYALQAVLYLGSRSRGEAILQRQISADLDIPPHFLGKVLQALTRRGLVSSQKGKTGGFRLARSPKTISLLDVIQAVDGLGVLDGCLLGFPGCSDDHPCPFHEEWKQAKQIVLEGLEQRNVAALSKGMEPKLAWLKSRDLVTLSIGSGTEETGA